MTGPFSIVLFVLFVLNTRGVILDPKPLYSTRKLLLPALFVMALFWVTWNRRPTTTAYYGQAMGTTWSVQVADPPTGDIQAEIEKQLNIVNALMSTYQPDSEISRFNRTDTQPFNISKHTQKVLATAMTLYKDSNGAFDITIGPVVNAWGFGFPPSLTKPIESDLEEMKGYVGSNHLILNGDVLIKDNPNTKIDLSAIAKGYAVDLVSNRLLELNHTNFLIEVGGEIYAHGTKDNSSWMVGIEQPQQQQGSVQMILPLENLALATSGDYRNYKERNGIRYSHTIDPRTLNPIAHNVASISVIANSVMEADAWATALNVLGEEEAFRLAEEHNLAIYMLLREEDGQFRPRTNAAFGELLQKP